MSFTEKTSGALRYMTADNISVPHAFTTRYGGVSAGDFASLNLGRGRGDNENCVERNYEVIGREIGFHDGTLFYSRQVHKTCVRAVTACTKPEDNRLEADGLVTIRANAALMVFTADCVPILLHDPVKKAIAAVHSGWRGTAGDIIGKTVLKMQSEYGSRACDIKAAIGPCISKCCFETGGEVVDAMRETLGGTAEEFVSGAVFEGKWMVDLKGINRALLLRAGVLSQNITVSEECTACKPEKYWSHRKMGERRGSQAAIIMLKGDLLI